MKLITPDYYEKFHCIAERCRHNCCIGWEIDIDGDTLELYDSIGGEFGDRLRSGISRGETPCFRLGEGERCVFLNERGLCDIILNLGEDALCGICTDHPRYRNFYADRTEMGLGLCCEEACRIILGHTDPVSLITLEDDGNDAPDPEEAVFFEERRHVLAVLQDRSRPLRDRFEILKEEYGITDSDVSLPEWAEFYRGLERLDGAWDRYLDILCSCTEYSDSDSVIWENLAVYIVYRYSADQGTADSTALAIHTVKLLSTVCASVSADFEGVCEICRMWSSEIEYSDENIARILDRLLY